MPDDAISISFDQIPLSIRVPGAYVEIDPSQANQGLYSLPTSIVVIGQVLAGAPIPLLTPTPVTRTDQIVSLCGDGSMLAQMGTAVLAGSQSALPVTLIAVADNAAGAFATGTATVGGVATSAGTLALYIGGRLVDVGVNAGDSAASVAGNIVSAIAATADMPVTAAAAGAVVTCTARHRGVCGNAIDLRANYNAGDATPAGLTLTFAAMAGGTGNPLIAPALTVIGDHWYTDYVCPYTDPINLAALAAQLGANYGPLIMRDGTGWCAVPGSWSAAMTLGQSLNSPQLSILALQGAPSLAWEWAAVTAGVAAYYLSIDPARPLQTLPLPGLLAPAIADRWLWSERNQALYSGISTYRVGSGNLPVIERCITTYQKTAFGGTDPSYLDIETLRTLALLRFDLQNYITVTLPRFKLGDDGTNFGRGQNVVTPSVIRGLMVARAAQWETQGLIEDLDQFKAGLLVARNPNDPNRIDALVPPNIINQLRVTAVKMQFLL